MSPSRALKPITRLGWFIILLISLALPQASFASPVSTIDTPAALTYTWTATWTAAGEPFAQPDRLAAAPDGTFYALETGVKRLRHIGANGELLATYSPSNGQGNLVAPVDMAVDGFSRLYVLEEEEFSPDREARIIRYSNDTFDTVFTPWWASGIGAPGLGLRSVAIMGDTIVMITGNVIVRFDLAGQRIGQTYPAWNQNLSFRDMALTADGRIYRLHSDEGNYGIPPVQIVDLRGNELGKWGINQGDKDAPPPDPGVFIYPSDITADLRGHILVLDTEQSANATNRTRSCRAQVFDESGAYLTEFGGCGSADGEFDNPQSIVALADGRIVVADTGNDRLQVFTPSELPPLRPLPGPTAWDAPVASRPGTWEDWGPRGVGRIDMVIIPPRPSRERPIVGFYGDRGVTLSADLVTWERQSAWWPGTDRGSVQPPFKVGEVRYAGSHTLLATGMKQDASYRSEDFGRTWLRLGDAPGTAARFIAPSPAYDADRTLFLASEDGRIWRSTDAGATWQLRSSLADRVSDLEVLPGAGDARILLVAGWGMDCCKQGILRSTDDGATWTEVAPADARNRRLFVSPTFAQDQTVIAAPDALSFHPDFLRSVDGGKTWTPLPLGGNYYFPLGSPAVTFSPNYAVDKTLLAWDETSRSYLSTDGGDTWKKFDSGPIAIGPVSVLKWLAFSPNYATDGAVWRQRKGAAGVEVTTDGAATWGPLGAAPGDAIRSLVAPSDAAVPWAATRDAIFPLSGSPGNVTPLQSLNFRDGMSVAIAFSPDFANDKTAIAGSAITRDAGATWRPLPFESQIQNTKWAEAAFAPDYPSSRRILVAYDNEPLDHPGVEWTADDGATWQVVRVPLGGLRSLTFDAVNPLKVYAGGEGGVAVSKDGGQSWENAGGPLSLLRVAGLLAREESGANVLYVATSSAGMWRGRDGGMAWEKMNAGLADGRLCALGGNRNMLAVATCAGQLYLSSAPFGWWEPVGNPLPAEPTELLAQGSRFAGRVVAGTTVGVFSMRQAVSDPRRLWLPVVE